MKKAYNPGVEERDMLCLVFLQWFAYSQDPVLEGAEENWGHERGIDQRNHDKIEVVVQVFSET